MRLNGLIWIGLAAALGAGYLYLTTRVQGMDAELARIEKRVDAERERLGVARHVPGHDRRRPELSHPARESEHHAIEDAARRERQRDAQQHARA